MNCACGNSMSRQEHRLDSGKRETVFQCAHCYRREIELRTAHGMLIRWRHDFHKPAGKKNVHAMVIDDPHNVKPFDKAKAKEWYDKELGGYSIRGSRIVTGMDVGHEDKSTFCTLAVGKDGSISVINVKSEK